MSGKYLVAFGEGQAAVVVEVEDKRSGPQPASRAGEASVKVKKTFEEAVAGIRPIATALFSAVHGLAPEEVEIEFGIKVSVEAGVVLASAASEAHCVVKLKWKRPDEQMTSHAPA